MIRSMTGYGDAERQTPAGRLRAEVKAVNHRFFSAQVRSPTALDRYENQIRDWLRGRMPRGHVTCSLRLESTGTEEAGSGPLTLDEGRARQYLNVLRSMKERLDLPGDVDVALLSRFSDLIVPATDGAPEVAIEDVRAVVETAADAAVAMRTNEGRRLAEDLGERLVAIEAAMRAVEARAPARLLAERDRIRRVVQELATDVDVDEERLAREIAYLAERWDVSEELVRLRSHIDLFRETLRLESAEPVGKRLGFLIQEMNREANTIGSKANDAEIEHQVVAIKNEIERLREQVENVE